MISGIAEYLPSLASANTSAEVFQAVSRLSNPPFQSPVLRALWTDSMDFFFTLVAVFVTSRVIKLFNGLRTVNHIPGYRPPFTPLGFPGVLPTRWWNTGLDVHFVRRHDMYKEREYMSLVPFISGKPAIWSNNLDVAKQVEAGGARGLFFKPDSSSMALRLWGTNLAASNGEAWRKHRRVMGPAFNIPNRMGKDVRSLQRNGFWRGVGNETRSRRGPSSIHNVQGSINHVEALLASWHLLSLEHVDLDFRAAGS
ncbi:cytochrome p450 [Moniliophthora roreri MCA 2997]|uniref:Cytochrome p450 n=1 Tax=Moniliophthora roreri (strain MCA 2997) TaxID=1381753 RepID=V2Y7X8_MONRO|nr:cytochrome p450 [Moniliophthora roreri MCA 2997]